jgi:large subunit ribosomal protein L9
MATKLLLIEDVEDLGRSGDIVSVKPGYARNKLIPSKSAVHADKRALRMQARLQETRLMKAAADKSDSDLLAQRIQDQTVTTTVKVDHDGHMYGSVTAIDVLELVKEQLSITLEKRWIQLPHAIKKTGQTEINLKLPEGVTAKFNLKILSEGAAEEEELAPAPTE